MPATTTARVVDPTTGAELVSYGGWTPAGILRSLDWAAPAPRESKTNRSGSHGSVDTTRWSGSRVITAVVAMPNQPDQDTAVDNLSGLMNPELRLWLYVQRPLWPTERRILVRGNAFTCPPGVNREAQAIWEAPDALFEDSVESSQTLIPSGTGTGGMHYPMHYPMSYGSGVVTGAAFVDTAGNTAAPFVVDMYGPCSDPMFRCTDTGEQVKFTGLSIADGDFLRVDTGAQTALLNNLSDQSRMNKLDFVTSNPQMRLPAGVTSQVVFSPASPSGNCRALLTWRSRYF
jgi:hypothetical protein